MVDDKENNPFEELAVPRPFSSDTAYKEVVENPSIIPQPVVDAIGHIQHDPDELTRTKDGSETLSDRPPPARDAAAVSADSHMVDGALAERLRGLADTLNREGGHLIKQGHASLSKKVLSLRAEVLKFLNDI